MSRGNNCWGGQNLSCDYDFWMIVVREAGLYCVAGDFYVDPWRAVPCAVITHAHADHARWGSSKYYCAAEGEGVLRTRIGEKAIINGIPYRETFRLGKALISFHPAGHILGSAQIRIEVEGEVWVISGDFKNDNDPSCDSFEVVACDTFVTESTFALPVYRWPSPALVFDEMNHWWRHNQVNSRTSVVFAYALGKAQRILCGLDASIGPIGVHGAVEKLNGHYREAGKPLPATVAAGVDSWDVLRGRGLIIAPGSVRNTPWLKKFAPYSLAFASGWMRVRGARRRGSFDRGFVLSDHADWPGLLATIRSTGARRVGVTHGFSDVLVRWLREVEGLESFVLPTRFGGEAASEKGEES
jgi:putative mRNA 3-end processing factor